MKFKRGPGGALLCDEPIKGVTQKLNKETAKEYGGEYFIGETIIKSAAKIIAEKFGGELEED